MASCQINNSSRGYIYDTLLKIDQLQKAANVETACEGCEGTLAAAYYNTKPIAIYLSNGARFTVEVPGGTTTTSTFRIENVRSDSVILRLLVPTGDTYDCLSYTIILSIDCICCLQCYPPICCLECNRCAGNL